VGGKFNSEYLYKDKTMSKEMREQIDKINKFNQFINENDNMRDINHNLEVAKPNFLYFTKNMNQELSQWIQYNGVEKDGSKIFFKFKSSQNSLNFKVYGGVDVNNTYELLSGKSNEIYEYFKKLKYDNF
jgi:hypothetical protein